jgi:hypothetical protein
MLWRVVVVLVCGGYVAHRLALALKIAQAKRSGDTERERRLRRRGFGLHRWAAGALVIFVLALTLLVWSNSR